MWRKQKKREERKIYLHHNKNKLKRNKNKLPIANLPIAPGHPKDN